MNRTILALAALALAALALAAPCYGQAVSTPIAKRLVFDVRDYGAVGNGSTDDTTAINAASTAAEAAGGVLFVPEATYVISGAGVAVGVNTTLRMDDMATFQYGGTAACLTIAGSNTNNPRQSRSHQVGRLFLGNATGLGEPTWSSASDTTSVGLLIEGCYADDFSIRSICRFCTGISMPSTNDNTCCNTIRLGRIVNNQTGIHIDQANAVAGTNQNTFIGGQIRIDSAWTAGTGRHIWITRDTAESNGNTFIGVNLEKGGNDIGIECDGDYNVFLNCRLEGATAGYVVFGTGALYNTLLAPVDGPTKYWDGVVTDSGTSTWIDTNDRIGPKGVQWDLNAHGFYFGNGTADPTVFFGAYGTNRLHMSGTGFIGLRHTGAIHQEELDITTGATPTISGNIAKLTYASPTTLTSILGAGVASDVSCRLTLVATNGNATLGHNSGGTGNIRNKSGLDKLLSANVPVTYVSADGLWYEESSARPLSFQFQPFAVGDTVTTGDGKVYYAVPAMINGSVITAVRADLLTASSSGAPNFDLTRIRSGTPVDILSTNLTVDQDETTSADATTPAVINTSNDDLQTGDLIRLDVDTAGTSTDFPMITVEVTQ